MAEPLAPLALVDDATGVRVGDADGVIVDVQRSGTGPVVMVLSGVEGVQADAPLIERLAADHDVVAPSHPGFDLSPGVDWFQGVDDLAYLYLQLLDDLDVHDVHVVGLQFGAWIAAEMAVRDTSRIGRMTLVGPVGIKTGSREDREIADVFLMSRAELDAARFVDPAANPLADPADASADALLRAARNEEALALYGWEPYLHSPNLHRWLARVRVPTIVLRGEYDGVISADYAAAYAAALPDSRLVTIPGAAHCAHLDQPAAVADEIRRG